MSRGFALLVGLKSVNPTAYGGWTGENGCWGCELDVDNIQRVLTPLGFEFGILKTAQATSHNILSALRGAARNLRSDDIFVFYYSGHGGQIQDKDGDEPDNKDETLVAYDKEVIDDDLNSIWQSFNAGSRIVMISDSCNSGSNYKMRLDIPFEKASPIKMFSAIADCDRSSTMTSQMIHYGGCRDGGSSAGYQGGGTFTSGFCRAWSSGTFSGNYRDLYARILEELRGERQQPQFSEYGPVTDAFRNQRPFTILDRSPSTAAEPIPTRDEVTQILSAIPIAWLYQPSLAENIPPESGARIAPLVAAAIGVAVGAGIQLGSQALNRAVASRPSLPSADFHCNLPYSAIEQLAGDLVDAARDDQEIADCLRKIITQDSDRPLPVIAAVFLAGVAAGAAAARP
ncbi:MAG: caspase family protein [Pirellulales bacterium]|nr:caspase family protein [Pirellulales bacterium]